MSYAARIRRSLRGCRPKLSFGLDLFEEGYCLDLFGFLIALPFLDRFAYDPEEIMDRWGVYYFERAIVFCWKSKSKSFYMPWSYVHISHDVLRPDGTWVPYVGCYETGSPIKNTSGLVVFEGGKEPDGRAIWESPYRYTLRSGEVQVRTATVYVDRMQCRQKWLKWTSWFAMNRQSIDVHFSDEIGERTGSWKGGVVGCGCTMLPGETALDTLRRMERERVFG